MHVYSTEAKPIKITKTSVYAKLDYSLKNRLGVRYYTDKKVYSRIASYIRDLRVQFSPFCGCEMDKGNPNNVVIEYDSENSEFYINGILLTDMVFQLIYTEAAEEWKQG
jgi:hypothetical protein